MHYPTISHYVELMSQAEVPFRTLHELRPCYTLQQEPLFRVGNFAVIFKMESETGCHALKCYTRPLGERAAVLAQLSEVGAPAVASRYLPAELFVHNEQGEGNYYPVSLSPWIEGESLGRRVGRLAQRADTQALRQLAISFDHVAT